MTEAQSASARRARGAARVALVATAYFAAAAVAAHIVAGARYDLVRNAISDYAVGPYGGIYGSAFLASFVGSVALAAALWEGVPRQALSRAGAVMLVIAGVSYVVNFFFPTDLLAPGQPPQTIVGLIHLAAALVGWCIFVVSAFMITLRLKADARWDRLRGALLILAWLALFILLALVAVTVAKWPIGGLVEKSFIVDRNLWVLIVALDLLRSNAASPARKLNTQAG